MDCVGISRMGWGLFFFSARFRGRCLREKKKKKKKERTRERGGHSKKVLGGGGGGVSEDQKWQPSSGRRRWCEKAPKWQRVT